MNLNEALKARNKAYVPYSKFKVGAAITLKNGTIIHGANVENSSFGLSCCAERNAIFSMVSQGYNPKDVVEMTVVGDTKGPISPCGACRQVMLELIPKDAKIYLTNLTGDFKEFTVEGLLPFGFDLEDDKVND